MGRPLWAAIRDGFLEGCGRVDFDFGTVDTGATAWVLVSAVLVLVMTPAIALFYGGMVRAKHVLSMIMQSFVTIALASLVWIVAGYTLAFGEGNGFVGDLRFAVLAHMDEVVPGFTGEKAMVIPPLVFAIFQMMFAVVTPALIVGSAVGRWRFKAFILFMTLWSLLVYPVVAHWIFSPTGWARDENGAVLDGLDLPHALDFAGGTVVHANAGAAGLALAWVLGPRLGWPWRGQDRPSPHNLPMMLLGAALLWVGWLGFNAGSALTLRPDGTTVVAAYAFVNTVAAASSAMLTWVCGERLLTSKRKATTLGAASGMVAGLVAVTPAAGYVATRDAVLIGVMAGFGCGIALPLKTWLRADDTLDVAALHLVGGVIGSLGVGFFATTEVNPDGADGLFSGGGWGQLVAQAVTVVAVVAYSLVVTYLLGRVVGRSLGDRGTVPDRGTRRGRVPQQAERDGLDQSLHGESAYRWVDASPPDAADESQAPKRSRTVASDEEG